MSVPVEAQSLSELNYLLANPPQYPRNPTHEAHQPLILYIVRVPGSRDVFLTPLKPPTKSSISLEAIQSSLYYLHEQCWEDEEVRESVEQERTASVAAENAAVNIHRKPLPSTPHANYPASQRPEPPLKSYPSYQPGLDGQTDPSQLERYHARGSNISLGGGGDRVGGGAGPVSRKPLGPRKFKDQPEFDPNRGSQDLLSLKYGDFQGSSRSLEAAYQHDGDARLLDDMPGLFPASHSPRQHANGSLDNVRPPMKPPRPLTTHGNTDKHPAITLIRRDPASGVQWNVGTIGAGGKLINSTLRSVSVELDTPGYIKFGPQHEHPLPVDFTDAESVKRAMATAQDTSIASGSLSADVFRRTVEFRPQQVRGKQFNLRSRTNSMDAIPNFPIQNKPLRTVYSFFSPWQGLCSFSNGIDGKSLRCRHALPSHGSDEDEATESVAELRFNLARSALSPRDQERKNGGDVEADTLPISQLLKDPRGGKQALRKGVSHIKSFSRDLKERRVREKNYAFDNEYSSSRPPPLPPRPQSMISGAESRDDLERLSLRLGREKAGGGYRGNSAKLGKLIIENEGLKMGDLVVAACMGVWWQHYAEQGY